MSRKPKRRTVIQFIVTAKEKRAIQKAAKAVQFSLSEWLRCRAFYDSIVEAGADPHNALRSRRGTPIGPGPHA